MRSTDFVTLRQRCIALIETHYMDTRVTPMWLARQLYISRRQLDRVFTGLPGVAETLAKRRLKQVVLLAARNPAVPMSEIAKRCGYGTYETFRAQCHRYLQCGPREARSDHGRALSTVRELTEVI